jgi:transcriptional regulator with XRE-family HTH domain
MAGILTDGNYQTAIMQEEKLTFGNFAEHLAVLIRQRAVTAKEVADATGVTAAALSRYLSGQRQPRYKEAEKLADYFGVAPDYLLNPARYQRPFEIAKKAAAEFEGTDKERDKVFNDVLRYETDKVRSWQDGFSEAESVLREEPVVFGGIDWRGRALVAEAKLANLRIKMGDLLNEL